MVNVDDAIIARLESFGEKFEILVDADLAADFRNPDHTEEIPIEDILAVEEIFKVKVADVNTINVTGKIKRMGRTMGRRPSYKKAIVKLAAGETIAFFEA